MVDWSAAERSKDCAQGVVQYHIQFLCVGASVPDRCTVFGGGKDQSLVGDPEGFRCGSPSYSGEVEYLEDSGDSGCCFLLTSSPGFVG